MIVVVVLDMHLVHAMVDVCEILVVVHLIGISLVPRVNILLILLQPAVRSAHQLLLSHFNTGSIDLLKESQEVPVVNDVVKRGSEEVDQSEELTGLHLLLAAVEYHVHEVSLLDHACLVASSLLELRLEVQLVLLVQFTDASQHRHSQWILKDHFFFQLLRSRGSEGVRLVSLEGRTTEEVAFRSDHILRGLLVSEEQHLIRDFRIASVLL